MRTYERFEDRPSLLLKRAHPTVIAVGADTSDLKVRVLASGPVALHTRTAGQLRRCAGRHAWRPARHCGCDVAGSSVAASVGDYE